MRFVVFLLSNIDSMLCSKSVSAGLAIWDIKFCKFLQNLSDFLYKVKYFSEILKENLYLFWNSL